MRTSMRWGGKVVAAMALVAATMACTAAVPESTTRAKPPETAKTGESAKSGPPRAAELPPVDANWPRWGLTHTQTSGNNGDDRLLSGSSATLSRVPMLQNQHIMGFGVGNPEEVPGQLNFEDLDSRMRLMDRSGGLPIITLCCAPDWMKGGPAGQTSWQKEHLEAAPERKHFDDFAKLSAAVAKRYDHVKYFMVWNELKGFWPDHSQPPDIEGYTELYNKVYDAVKAVRPDALIGGPYIGFHSIRSDGGNASSLRGDWGAVDQLVLDAFDYWNKNKRGADFIVIDGASVTDDHKVQPDAFGATAKFGDVTRWLREKTGNLPVWWSEFYFMPEDGKTNWPENMRVAVLATSLMEFASSGTATALYWNPQTKQGDCVGCMWNSQDGSARPAGDVVSNFVKWFPAGAKLEKVTSSDERVRVLAQPEQMVMVNTTDKDVTATVDGQEVSLAPYEVKWAARG
ncbi:xylan 1,4-beta-xylosidase [Nonomuraea sp. NPDC050310]|uniref:xylan 1,4-beta-xylosidase n=1 Tax=Nonomuraea sp. NPDC050310 TaxID=3154935 RepID=UPI0033E03BB9